MNDRFQNRRRNYYIQKEFQRNFIMKFSGLIVLGAVISGAIIYLMSRPTVVTIFEAGRLTIKNTAVYMLPALFFASAVVVLVIGAATIFLTLFTSHKIAGPLYRMEKDIGEVASGNLNKRFNLRTGDELKALAVSLDVMAHNLRGKVAILKKHADEIEVKAAGWDAEISNKARELKKILDEFKT